MCENKSMPSLHATIACVVSHALQDVCVCVCVYMIQGHGMSSHGLHSADTSECHAYSAHGIWVCVWVGGRVALPVALEAAADDENEGDCSTEYACGMLACIRGVVLSPVAIFSPRDSFIVVVSMDGETDSAQCS